MLETCPIESFLRLFNNYFSTINYFYEAPCDKALYAPLTNAVHILVDEISNLDNKSSSNVDSFACDVRDDYGFVIGFHYLRNAVKNSTLISASFVATHSALSQCRSDYLHKISDKSFLRNLENSIEVQTFEDDAEDCGDNFYDSYCSETFHCYNVNLNLFDFPTQIPDFD